MKLGYTPLRFYSEVAPSSSPLNQGGLFLDISLLLSSLGTETKNPDGTANHSPIMKFLHDDYGNGEFCVALSQLLLKRTFL